MLQSVVNQQMLGATDLRSPTEYSVEKDLRSSREDSSFEKTLEDKISSQSLKKETRESSPQEPKVAKDSKETRESKDAKDSTDSGDTKKPTERAQKKELTVRKPTEKAAQNRKQAIKEFMDSFESEFQIPPTRLVEAMAQLSDKEIVQAPEETVDSVVSQLGLDDSQTDKAAAMYAGLLAQLNQLQQQAPPVPQVALSQGNPQQLMQDRIALAQLQQSVKASSVEDMNKKFWTPQSLIGDSMQSVNSDASGVEGLDLSEEVLNQQEVVAASNSGEPKKSAFDVLPPHLQGQMRDSVSPAVLAALAAKKAAMNSDSEDSSENQEMTSLMDDFQQAIVSPGADKNSQMAVNNKAQGKLSQEFFQNQSQGQNLLQQKLQALNAKEARGTGEAVSKITEKLDFKQSLNGTEGAIAQPLKGDRLASDFYIPPTAAGMQAPRGAGEHEANVKQIMSQAQYLIQKGGGEVKVTMNPEGMGSIDLKVMLQDGKVNLQMSADTHEAKKVIESSLADLKTSLAVHKLSIENVKVDVVNSTSTDTATQNQTNMNGHGQRDQARQFWNQFNDNFGSQGRRESLMDMPNLKGYGNRERNPLNPIESSSVARTRTVEGKGKGLNLVA